MSAMTLGYPIRIRNLLNHDAGKIGNGMYFHEM